MAGRLKVPRVVIPSEMKISRVLGVLIPVPSAHMPLPLPLSRLLPCRADLMPWFLRDCQPWVLAS
jgi:hypothetical protein